MQFPIVEFPVGEDGVAEVVVVAEVTSLGITLALTKAKLKVRREKRHNSICISVKGRGVENLERGQRSKNSQGGCMTK